MSPTACSRVAAIGTIWPSCCSNWLMSATPCIIENDWLEAIVALPLNMFYNTGIATYIWVVTNRKPEHRRGKVQLIDATKWYKPLRKNLGKKNCELSEADIKTICGTFLAFDETEQSKIFSNEAFGYQKVTVGRPLRTSRRSSTTSSSATTFPSSHGRTRCDRHL
jgi:type I restriction-modification system DNA methylase subunit